MEMKLKVYQSPRRARPRFNGTLKKLQAMGMLAHKHCKGKMMTVIKFWKSKSHAREMFWKQYTRIITVLDNTIRSVLSACLLSYIH